MCFFLYIRREEHIYMYVYTCTYVYMYIHTYICTHMYVYMHFLIYFSRCNADISTYFSTSNVLHICAFYAYFAQKTGEQS